MTCWSVRQRPLRRANPRLPKQRNPQTSRSKVGLSGPRSCPETGLYRGEDTGPAPSYPPPPARVGSPWVAVRSAERSPSTCVRRVEEHSDVFDRLCGKSQGEDGCAGRLLCRASGTVRPPAGGAAAGRLGGEVEPGVGPGGSGSEAFVVSPALVGDDFMNGVLVHIKFRPVDPGLGPCPDG